MLPDLFRRSRAPSGVQWSLSARPAAASRFRLAAGCPGDRVASLNHSRSTRRIATERVQTSLSIHPCTQECGCPGLEPPKLTVAGPRSWLEPGQKEAGKSLGPLRWRDEQVIVCQLAKKNAKLWNEPLAFTSLKK